MGEEHKRDIIYNYHALLNCFVMRDDPVPELTEKLAGLKKLQEIRMAFSELFGEVEQELRGQLARLDAAFQKDDKTAGLETSAVEDFFGARPLHAAVEKGFLPVVERLVVSGEP